MNKKFTATRIQLGPKLFDNVFIELLLKNTPHELNRALGVMGRSVYSDFEFDPGENPGKVFFQPQKMVLEPNFETAMARNPASILHLLRMRAFTQLIPQDFRQRINHDTLEVYFVGIPIKCHTVGVVSPVFPYITYRKRRGRMGASGPGNWNFGWRSASVICEMRKRMPHWQYAVLG